MRKYFLAFVFILVVLFSARSQSHTPRNVLINTNCNGFYEYLPANYASSTSKFPLIIYCGGAGTFGTGIGAELNKLLEEGVPYYINTNQFPSTFTVNGQSFSFLVISPQFIRWGAPDDVEAVINYAIKHYSVDESRIYLAGFSAGGDAAWKYPNSGSSRSRRIAALVPVAGYNYPYVDSGAKYIAAANLPVWALHSNDDGPAPAYWTQNFVDKINSYNPATPARITRFNGPTHDQTKLHVYDPAFKDSSYNIYEWMLLYRRSYPPVANAGMDMVTTLPLNSVTLHGGASFDPEHNPLSFSWSKIIGPMQYSINDPNSANPVVSNLTEGVYHFELTVVDSDGLSAKDTVKVHVINPLPSPAASQLSNVSNEERSVTALVLSNPFHSHLRLSLSDGYSGKMVVLVVDGNGRTVKRLEYTKQPSYFSRDIPLAELPRGTYFLRVEMGKKIYSEKIVKLD